jgi:O-antigen ligase
MDSLKPRQWAVIALGTGIALYLCYSHLQYFGDMPFLAGILLLEVILACIWKFDERFFVLLMIAFIWEGISVPFRGPWATGRWVVLFVGAVVGYIVWAKSPRKPFGALHLFAFFCICAAFVSATVSLWVRMASLKALSLFLLFAYCASGARAAVIGRERSFFRGLLWGCEIAVYFTAICYFVLGESIWGNPNSLGAAMSIGVFPILLWGWRTSDGPTARFRRLVAFLLCTYLIFFSMARAAIVSILLVTLVFCFCLHQYKLLLRIAALFLFGAALAGMLAPGTLETKLFDFKEALLYKGHKDEGILGSRLTPWQKTIASIKAHPMFGTGYGTAPTGEDPGFGFGTTSSSAETAREHGSSYMAITEWVGLLGVLPFIMLVGLTAANVWKVCASMNRNVDPRQYSIPLAMVVLAGLVHAGFEDWLFAVGSYLCVYFWFFAFLLADFVPSAAAVPVARAVSRVPRSSPAAFEGAVPTR